MAQALMDLDITGMKRFSFSGIKVLCRVVKCYDGDTCTVVFKYAGKYIKLTCRLANINAPEIRGCTNDEKRLGLLAKDFLAKEILEKVLPVEFFENDKYGRPIVVIYDKEGNSINDKLVSMGHAQPFMVRKRKKNNSVRNGPLI